ncbi:hypothetical protein NKH69_09000 [Mesorhizobium sp. M0976]|uniref:hypothetical protein n=1 Tax=unclassified Mesorhizobium TaxID=325217 RepID=UPI00333BD474
MKASRMISSRRCQWLSRAGRDRRGSRRARRCRALERDLAARSRLLDYRFWCDVFHLLRKTKLTELLPDQPCSVGMTRIADLGPRISGKPYGKKPTNGHDHFHTCPICGQQVDRRDFRQVMWHEQADHEPLELDN